MKRRNDAYSSSASWHHIITITTLVVSLICFALFYNKINKMNDEIEGILNISFMKSDFIVSVNTVLTMHPDDEEKQQDLVSDLYQGYVRAIFKTTISDAIKYEEAHFAENIYLKTHILNSGQKYQSLELSKNHFTDLARNQLEKTKNIYKKQLIILIFIPTLMALFRSIQAIYYFYSLRKLRGNYMIDPLTGVHNRRFMNAVREREDVCYILAIDIDDFKSVNDNYGHAFGDKVLQECARTMKSHVRDHDIVVRMGGDEFSIFLFKTDSKGAKTVANRVLSTINSMKLLLANGEFFTPSLSIGLARCEGNIENALIEADQNLYLSKKSGKNTLTFDGDK